MMNAKKLMMLTCLVLALLLPVIASAGPTGVWVNVDPASGGLTRLEVSQVGADYYVRAFGNCTPTDCDWGEVPANLYYNTVTGGTILGVAAQWSFSFKEAFVEFTYNAFGDTLKAKVWNTYNDGRANMIFTDDFVHGK